MHHIKKTFKSFKLLFQKNEARFSKKKKIPFYKKKKDPPEKTVPVKKKKKIPRKALCPIICIFQNKKN